MTDLSADDHDRPHDLVGIGIGPFNLSLAALADGVHGGLDAVFYEQRPAFHWHPGLLLDGARLQVPFLADLVTLVDPASPWSFLSYLRARERLYPFYFAERFHIQRAEYDAYCRWVSEQLPGLHFGHQVDAVRWNGERGLFEVDFTQLDSDGEVEALGRAYTRDVVLGIGTEPYIPDPLKLLAEAPAVPVIHSADYLDHRERILEAEHITVVGSGQSGAEVFLDLLRARPAGAEKLHWLARTDAFSPMEYSKLGLEHFTPDYTAYFHALPEQARDELVPRQWQLHKGIDTDTIAAIHDELYRRTTHGGWPDAVLTPGVLVRTAGRVGATRIELHLEHAQQSGRSRLTTDAVVLATGYRERPLGGSWPDSTRTCGSTNPSARASTTATDWPSTPRSPARSTYRTPNATHTASAPPTSDSPPGAAPPSSTRTPAPSPTHCPTAPRSPASASTDRKGTGRCRCPGASCRSPKCADPLPPRGLRRCGAEGTAPHRRVIARRVRRPGCRRA